VTRGDAALVEKALLEAIDLAESSHADLAAARAWVVMPMVYAVSGTKAEQIEVWTRRARAALDRVGKPPRLEAMFGVIHGVAIGRSGRSAEGYAEFERALGLYRGMEDPDLFFYSLALMDVGAARTSTVPSAAAPYYDEAIDLVSTRLGPTHPNLMWTLAERAYLSAFQGEHAAADRACRQSLAIWSRGATGEAHTRDSVILQCADVKRAAGDPAAALAMLDQLDPKPATPWLLGRRELVRGEILLTLGRPKDARLAFERAREPCAGPGNCMDEVLVARASHALGARAEALAEARAALLALSSAEAPKRRLRHAALVLLAELGDDRVGRLAEARAIEQTDEISAENKQWREKVERQGR
jgi:hypothetical protein